MCAVWREAGVLHADTDEECGRADDDFLQMLQPHLRIPVERELSKGMGVAREAQATAICTTSYH